MKLCLRFFFFTLFFSYSLSFCSRFTYISSFSLYVSFPNRFIQFLSNFLSLILVFLLFLAFFQFQPLLWFLSKFWLFFILSFPFFLNCLFRSLPSCSVLFIDSLGISKLLSLLQNFLTILCWFQYRLFFSLFSLCLQITVLVFWTLFFS